MRTRYLTRVPRILVSNACSVSIESTTTLVGRTNGRHLVRHFSSNVARAQSIEDSKGGRQVVHSLPKVPPIPIATTISNLSDVLARKPVSEKLWFSLFEGLRVALSEMGITQPSEIQRLAIPAILSGKDVVLSAATGTGKTLSYLLPMAHKLKVEELENGITARPGRPRAIVLAPTRELALQITSVAKELCHKAKFSVGVLVGGRKERWQREMCEKPVDLMIGTPGRFIQAIDRGWITLNDVRLVAIDESDVMINADQNETGFTRDMHRIIRPLQLASERRKQEAQEVFSSMDSAPSSQYSISLDKSANTGTSEENIPFPVASFLAARNTSQSFLYPLAVKTQFICAGATMNTRAVQTARDLIPTLEVVATASTLRPPVTLEQKFIRVGGGPNAKHTYLREALEAILPTSMTRPSDSFVDDDDYEMLDDNVENDSGSFDVQQQARDFAQSLAHSGKTKLPKNARVIVFCNSVSSCRSTAHFIGELGYKIACLHGEIPPRLRQSEYTLFNDKQCSVLVATDASARGLDFQDVSHVILFDFPSSPAEYLHRVGRTARGNNPGVAISFVTKKDAPLALAIERASAESITSRNRRNRRQSTDLEPSSADDEFAADTVSTQNLPVTGVDFTTFSSSKYDYVPPKLRGEYKAALARRQQKKEDRLLREGSNNTPSTPPPAASASTSKWAEWQNTLRTSSKGRSPAHAGRKDPFVVLNKEMRDASKKGVKKRKA